MACQLSKPGRVDHSNKHKKQNYTNQDSLATYNTPNAVNQMGWAMPGAMLLLCLRESPEAVPEGLTESVPKHLNDHLQLTHSSTSYLTPAVNRQPGYRRGNS
jgi:hypothetical protein